MFNGQICWIVEFYADENGHFSTAREHFNRGTAVFLTNVYSSLVHIRSRSFGVVYLKAFHFIDFSDWNCITIEVWIPDIVVSSFQMVGLLANIVLDWSDFGMVKTKMAAIL